MVFFFLLFSHFFFFFFSCPFPSCFFSMRKERNHADFAKEAVYFGAFRFLLSLSWLATSSLSFFFCQWWALLVTVSRWMAFVGSPPGRSRGQVLLPRLALFYWLCAAALSKRDSFDPKGSPFTIIRQNFSVIDPCPSPGLTDTALRSQAFSFVDGDVI